MHRDKLLDPDTITNDQLRLHMGEMTADECGIARAAIRLANFHAREYYQAQLEQTSVNTDPK